MLSELTSVHPPLGIGQSESYANVQTVFVVKMWPGMAFAQGYTD